MIYSPLDNQWDWIELLRTHAGRLIQKPIVRIQCGLSLTVSDTVYFCLYIYFLCVILWFDLFGIIWVSLFCVSLFAWFGVYCVCYFIWWYCDHGVKPDRLIELIPIMGQSQPYSENKLWLCHWFYWCWFIDEIAYIPKLNKAFVFL